MNRHEIFKHGRAVRKCIGAYAHMSTSYPLMVTIYVLIHSIPADSSEVWLHKVLSVDSDSSDVSIIVTLIIPQSYLC